MKKLSSAAHHIEGQPMFKLLAQVKEMEQHGADIIHFEIGDPDFSTPPNIVEVACASLRQSETHYISSMGLRDMRMAVRQVTEKSRGFLPDVDQVLITPGANTIIYYAVRCLVEAGEDVMIPNPYFPTYLSVLHFCGVNPIFIPLKEKNNFRMNPRDIRSRITDKTRLIIINSPHNPTGSVMTQEELDEVYNIAEERDVYLLSDEVYSRMIYDPSGKFYSPAIRDGCRRRTIITNGFSKAFAMTGWRLGCAMGPTDVIEKMGLLLQTTVSCVPPFIQRAGIEAMQGSQEHVRNMIQEYRARRDLLVKRLNELPGVTCLKPGGAFYVFPNIQGTGMDDETFAKMMLEKAGVALLPGSNFGENGRGYVRMCYANSPANILKGVERMERCLRKRSSYD